MHIQGNRLHCLKASETLLNLAAWILYNYGRVMSFSVNMLTLNFNQSLRLSFHCGQYYLINPYGISVSQMITDVFPDVVITRVIRWVPLMDQEQVTLAEHQSSSMEFCGVRASQSFLWCIFVDHWLSFFPVSFVCTSSVYSL